MTTAVGRETRIDSYLARVRTALRGVPEGDIEDILRELRSHAVELSGRDGQGMEEALRSLGDPVELAKTYQAENRMVRAECSRSPLVILEGLRHTTRTRLGRVAATALYLLGYINLFILWAAAAEKLITPSRGGLWYVPGDSWSLTLVIFDYPPPGARELLGWWLVPIGLLAGWGVKVLTDRLAQWWIARYRRSRESLEA